MIFGQFFSVELHSDQYDSIGSRQIITIWRLEKSGTYRTNTVSTEMADVELPLRWQYLETNESATRVPFRHQPARYEIILAIPITLCGTSNSKRRSRVGCDDQISPSNNNYRGKQNRAQVIEGPTYSMNPCTSMPG